MGTQDLCQYELTVSGMKCSACLAKLSTLSSDRKALDLQGNLSTQSVKISYDPHKYTKSQILQLIRQAGFTPIEELNSTTANLKQKYFILRLGVAWFCLGNIMLFAFAEYLSDQNLEPSLLLFFRSLSLLLATLCISFSAYPFYTTAYRSLKSFKFDIYIPIVFAIFLAYILSIYSIYKVENHIYLDTITAIITLLLTGQYFQQKIIQNTERYINNIKSTYSEFVLCKTGNDYEYKKVKELVANDLLRLLPGDVCPVTCKLLSSSAIINKELVNGEAESYFLNKDDDIPSGAIIEQSPVEAICIEGFSTSFVQKVSQSSFEIYNQKTKFGEMAEVASRFFVYGLLIITTLIFLYHLQTSTADAIIFSIAALLAACPCSLGLSIPLTYSTMAARALREGIVFRSERSLEEAYKIKDIYFDKTGTLTTGELQVDKVNVEEAFYLDNNNPLAVLLSLENCSRHHNLSAIIKWAREQDPHNTHSKNELSNVREVFGTGIYFSLNSDHYFIGKNTDYNEDYTTLFSKNNIVLARFAFKEELRPEAKSVIEQLLNMNKNVFILSGDQALKCLAVAKELKISKQNVIASATPTQKHDAIQGTLNAMIGNGFNDSMAMAKSSLGIALGSAPMYTRKVCDIVLTKNNLEQLTKVFLFSKSSRRKLLTAFAFSACYNLMILTFAALGVLTPFIAAILMPISSAIITLVAISK